jgi:hypothetical protein
MRRFPALAILIGLLFCISALPGFAQPAIQNPPLPAPLPLFPPDNWWNLNVSAAPVDGQNLNYISLVNAIPVHPDFGGDASPAPATYGMTYVEVPGTEPLSTVLFDYASQSDDGALGRPPGYPIPPEAITQPHWIEGGYPGNQDQGSDQHMLIIDTDRRILFETWQSRYNVDHWEAGSGAIFYLDSNQRRPDGWTSGDAAGLAILPGLVRYDEAYGTAPIQHAIRLTLGGVCSYVFPASHLADTGCPQWPPLGARFRLKSTYTPPGGCTECTDPGFLRVVQAMKTYGLIVADTGSSMYISGTYDPRWDNGILNPAFGTIHGSDFDVIQTGWNPQPPIAGTGLSYHTIAPCRVVDTRRAPGAYGGPAIPGGGQRSFTITDPSGACGIPGGATGTQAVSVNVTVIIPPGAGDMRFWPANQPVPANSTINFRAGNTRANNAILSLSSSGSGALAVQNDMTSGSANITIDVNGYFQ